MSKISKVILRNKVYPITELSIKIEVLKDEERFTSFAEFIKCHDIIKIINDIYDEDIQEESLEKSSLYNSYLEVLNSGIENDDFIIAYKLRKDMAIRITNHIHVCHIAEDAFIDDKRIVPWNCIDRKTYKADSWWEEDDEILDDFTKLSYMEFIVKYKMY